MNDFHVIKATTLPATATRPARVKLRSELNNQDLTISFDHEPGTASPKTDTAIRWLNSHGFEIIGIEEGYRHTYVITKTLYKLLMI